MGEDMNEDMYEDMDEVINEDMDEDIYEDMDMKPKLKGEMPALLFFLGVCLLFFKICSPVDGLTR